MITSGCNDGQPKAGPYAGYRHTHRLVSVFIALIFLIAFFPLVHTGYAVPDDFQFSLWASSPERWKNAREAAEQTGRFQVFFHICLAYVPYFVDSHFYLKFVQIASMAMSAWLFAYTLTRYRGDCHFGLIVLLLFGALTQNMWEHHLFSAYPFVFQFGFSCLTLSFIAFQKMLIGGSRSSQWQTGIFLFLALLAYETFALYIAIFLFIAWAYKKSQGWRVILSAMAPVFICIFIFSTVYLTWRWQYPTNYAGARVDPATLDWAHIRQVIWQFSWASFPGYVLTHFTAIHHAFPVSPEGFNRNFASLFQNMQSEWIVKAVLVGFGIWLTQSIKNSPLTRQRFIALLAVSILLVFLPPLPLALTSKYQNWVNIFGVNAYVVTYFSYFGVVLFLATFATAFGQLGKPGGLLKRVSVGTVAVVVMFLSLLTDYGNAAMNRSQSLEAWKWRMFDQVINSPDFQTVSSGDCVLLDGLTAGLAFGFSPPDYWQKRIEQRTGKQVPVFDDRTVFTQCMVAGNKPGFLVRYQQEANIANQFIVVARVLGEENGRLIGNQAVLYSLGHSRRFMLTWLAPGLDRKAVATIDNVSVVGQGGYASFLVNKLEQNRGSLRTEIRIPNLALDSLGVNYFVENLQPHQ